MRTVARYLRKCLSRRESREYGRLQSIESEERSGKEEYGLDGRRAMITPLSTSEWTDGYDDAPLSSATDECSQMTTRTAAKIVRSASGGRDSPSLKLRVGGQVYIAFMAPVPFLAHVRCTLRPISRARLQWRTTLKPCS